MNPQVVCSDSATSDDNPEERSLDVDDGRVSEFDTYSGICKTRSYRKVDGRRRWTCFRI